MLSSRAAARARRGAALRRFARSYAAHRSGMAGLVILGLFALIALLAPVLFPADMLDITKTVQNETLEPPSGEFWLGTDEGGRSILAVLAWAARASLTVGVAASAISMVLGTLVGIGSGHYRGLLGSLLQRLTDWFLVIPFIPLVVVLAAVLGQRGLGTIVLVLGVTSWPGTARLVRAQTLSVEGRPYLERAKALGGSDWHQMVRHVLPNVMPLVLANTTLTVALVILSETTLAFLGLGDPYLDSWGTMLDKANGAGAASTGAWWYLLPPGICVILVVLAFTLIGRALESVLDPRLGRD
ncbi:MAG: transporter permease [Nocardioidaceae bacterium]|jgi:peptide/nickel transport system permease protein|nr:transporter permease [Nocardioidaceae bacterium]